jgi:anti-sigma regulatory factor (Ser/Thr protein kinase)
MAVYHELAFAHFSRVLHRLNSHMDQMKAKVPPAERPASPWVEVRQSLPRRAAAISPFVNQLMSFIRRFFQSSGSTNTAKHHIEIALREALSNAILNHGVESVETRVFVSCRCTMDGEVRIRVRDEEPRFEAFSAFTTTDGHLRGLDQGRGLCLLKSLMDEVALEEHGKVVMMRKRLRAA